MTIRRTPADVVQFTRESAERISRVVRESEMAPLPGSALTMSPLPEAPRKVFRICTFTGEWAIGSAKTVTFKNKTTMPNTVSASNLFWPVPDGPQRDCAIAKEGTAWYLLVPQLYAANAATAATLTTASLEFNTLPVVALATSSTAKFSVTPKTITAVTDVQLTSDALKFTRVSAGVFFDNTASTVSISISTCATATT